MEATLLEVPMMVAAMLVSPVSKVCAAGNEACITGALPKN